MAFFPLESAPYFSYVLSFVNISSIFGRFVRAFVENVRQSRVQRTESERQHQPRDAFQKRLKGTRQSVTGEGFREQGYADNRYSRRGQNRWNLIRNFLVLLRELVGVELRRSTFTDARATRRDAADSLSIAVAIAIPRGTPIVGTKRWTSSSQKNVRGVEKQKEIFFFFFFRASSTSIESQAQEWGKLVK